MAKGIHNKEYKDSVFVDLFSADKNAKKNFLLLYNALHGTNLADTTPIEPLKLEQVIYMKFANDVSCLVDNKIIVLAEHQSTINENMPLRFLEYIGRLYEQVQNPRDKYLRKRISIPTPEFYVFYNGKESYPLNTTLKLSDAFKVQNKEVMLEVKVQVLNINYAEGNTILQKCKPLKEYSLFVETVRRHIQADEKGGFDKAIQECLENDILKEYLARKSKEVMNMLLTEYDYKTDIAVQREEERMIALQEGIEQGLERGIEQGLERGIEQGLERGIEQGLERGIEQGLVQGETRGKLSTAMLMKQSGFSVEIIAKMTELPIKTIEEL